MNKLLFFLVALFLSSCAGKSAQPQAVVNQTPVTAEQVLSAPAIDTFAKGQVITSVALLNQPTQSFALYIPKSLGDSSTPTAIIFFDPHGDGTMPVNLYKALAEQNQVMLVGSNSSRNGMDLQQSLRVATNLVNEVTQRLKVQNTNLTLCGFSGGAKVALLSAAENIRIPRVIYCGAAANITPNHPLNLLGFAGTRDMNYTDVVAFDKSLNASTIKHSLIEWQGKHEFPDAKTFADAFAWLSTGTVPGYEKKQVTITSQKLTEEQAIKQELLNAFQMRDVNWWKNEIAQLNTKKKTDPMYDRLLGFVSLACYSYSNQTLQQKNLPAAEKILTIYALADPGNKDCEMFIQQLKEMRGR